MPDPIKTEVVFVNTDSITDPKMSVCYTGDSGAGKTFAACSWPHPVVVCLESNTTTALSFSGLPFIDTASWAAENHREGEPAYKAELRLWQSGILPAIQNRRLGDLVQAAGLPDYEPETIVIDSLTSLGALFHTNLSRQGQQKIEFDGWGRYLNWFRTAIKTLTDVTKPSLRKPDRPTYNVVCTIHENKILDADGKLAKVVPMIDGQFKDAILSKFDSVFALQAETRRGDKGKVSGVEYRCYTVPPDRFRVARDGRGRRKQLPPMLPDGTYPTLAAAWGLTEST